MRKLSVNHAPTLRTRGNKTNAPPRTRIAALLSLSAALLATTLGGAAPASAEDAPPASPPPAPAPAATTPETAPAPAENAPPPPAPAPQPIFVQYRNMGAYHGEFCLRNAKSVKKVLVVKLNGEDPHEVEEKCKFTIQLFGNADFHDVVFEDGGKAKFEGWVESGLLGTHNETLEVPIGSDTKALCLESNGTIWNYDLYQVDCVSRSKIAS